jgi:hypothetical protein
MPATLTLSDEELAVFKTAAIVIRAAFVDEFFNLDKLPPQPTAGEVAMIVQICDRIEALTTEKPS